MKPAECHFSFNLDVTLRSFSSCWFQSAESQQVISGGRQMGILFGACNPDKMGFSESSHRLHPPEDLFHSLPDCLTESISFMPRCAVIQARGFAALDASDVRGNLFRP